MIRVARADELESLRDLDVAAGRAFAEVGMPEIARDHPGPLAELEAFRAAGRTLVAEGAGALAGYLLWMPVDDAAHVEQVSVHPDHARRGIGAALIDHVARTAGCSAVSLTTFRDVPWNAPYYARLGFTVLAPEDQGPQLRALVAEEAEDIPGDAPRVAMRRMVR